MTGIAIAHRNGKRALEMLDEIADIYAEIHAGEGDESFGMFSRQEFVARTGGQARSPGFDLVTATSEGSIAGFTFGYTFPPGRWWADCTPAPSDVLDCSKFAVIELDVRKRHRGHGLSRILLDTLLLGRLEDYATLATIPGSMAHSMYERWGWRKVGFFEDAPVMDAMLLPIYRAGPR